MKDAFRLFASFATLLFLWVFVLIKNELLFLATTAMFFALVIIATDKTRYAKKILRIFNILPPLYNFFSGIFADVKISRVSQDTALYVARPITNLKIFSRLQQKITKSIKADIRISGLAANPRLLGLQSVSYMVLAGIAAVPLAVMLSAFFDDAVFGILLLAPAFLFAFPTLRLKLLSSERKSQIEDELAFFAAYCAIMQNVGRSILDSFAQVSGAGIFLVLGRESRMLQRNVKIFAMDELSAINNLAINHPNRTFSNFLLGYVSIHKSGGDLARYLESKAEEFFNSIKFRMSQYSSQASTIGETLLIMLNVLPVLIISSSFLMPASSVHMITSASFVLVPFIAAVMILVTRHSQPKARDHVPFFYYSIPAGMTAAILAIILGMEHWQALVLAVLAGSIANSAVTFSRFQEISSLESSLPDLLRDITEYAKIGFPIPNSIIRISRERRYNQYLDSLVSEISSKIYFGYKLSDVVSSMKISSWNARLAFFVLGKIADSGGGRPQTLEYITNFVTKVNHAKKEMASSTKVFAFMVYSSPIMMVWLTSAMGDVMGQLGPSFEVLSGTGQVTLLSEMPEFIDIINMLIATSAICMGVVMSKVSSFTLKNTTGVAITSAVAFASIYFSSYIPSMGSLFGST